LKNQRKNYLLILQCQNQKKPEPVKEEMFDYDEFEDEFEDEDEMDEEGEEEAEDEEDD